MNRQPLVKIFDLTTVANRTILLKDSAEIEDYSDVKDRSNNVEALPKKKSENNSSTDRVPIEGITFLKDITTRRLQLLPKIVLIPEDSLSKTKYSLTEIIFRPRTSFYT